MADEISSFWGPVTSTHEWCEPNYVYSSYIAEFFNTISNVPGIILALIGLVISLSQRFEKRFSVLHISNMILAIGSMLYHSTLQQLQQQGDETPMVWEMLLYIYILYSPDWHYRSTMPTFLFLYGAVFAIAHSKLRFDIGFKWYFNLQGHALWHVFMGFNSYFANTFLMYCRAQQRGWDPKVNYFLGYFPYVKIQKPKAH
ncbi:Alkaline phytoceramidase (aPHC) [Abeliophyllum distichum]|uniref:Alkaline phytoceramidase (APHC) n=1 Tax=Abeliophyllum distichum TaxID=126358 RepID=A0ABD1NV91_9LAMI